MNGLTSRNKDFTRGSVRSHYSNAIATCRFCRRVWIRTAHKLSQAFGASGMPLRNTRPNLWRYEGYVGLSEAALSLSFPDGFATDSSVHLKQVRPFQTIIQRTHAPSRFSKIRIL